MRVYKVSQTVLFSSRYSEVDIRIARIGLLMLIDVQVDRNRNVCLFVCCFHQGTGNHYCDAMLPVSYERERQIQNSYYIRCVIHILNSA